MQMDAPNSSSSDNISHLLENLQLNSDNNNTISSQVENSLISQNTQQMSTNNYRREIRFNDFQNSLHESPPLYSLWSGYYLDSREEPISQFGNWNHQQSIHYDHYDLEVQRLLEIALHQLFELMIDQERNKTLKVFMDSCNESQLQLIVEKIISQPESFLIASKNSCGLSVIKKLLRLIQKSSLMNQMLELISFLFFDMMIDKISHHIILDCLHLLDVEKRKVLYQVAIQHTMNLASHEQGYVSLNSFITLLRRPYRDDMLNLISTHAIWFAQDPWGNFVLQHVLELHNPLYNEKICSQLKGNYERISVQEAGSYVVQKCLQTPVGMSYAVKELIKSKKLLQIAKDKYGNYVVQSALEVTKSANSPLYQQLVGKLQQHMDVLKHTHFGKHVFNKINNVSLGR